MVVEIDNLHMVSGQGSYVCGGNIQAEMLTHQGEEKK